MSHFVHQRGGRGLVGKVEEALRSYETQCDLGSNKELALDRLGQFLHCLTATGGIHGKLFEIFNSVREFKKVIDYYRCM